MEVVIEGIYYVPRVEIESSKESIHECLSVLTEMRYFNQNHKMRGLAWNAINALSPDLAKLNEREAYDFIHGTED